MTGILKGKEGGKQQRFEKKLNFTRGSIIIKLFINFKFFTTGD
jgi:hypothetical protein